MSEIGLRVEDLQFKVKVPEGCELVVALKLPSGQLVNLADLVAEDAGGVPVGAIGDRGVPRLKAEMERIDPEGAVVVGEKALVGRSGLG